MPNPISSQSSLAFDSHNPSVDINLKAPFPAASLRATQQQDFKPRKIVSSLALHHRDRKTPPCSFFT